MIPRVWSCFGGGLPTADQCLTIVKVAAKRIWLYSCLVPKPSAQKTILENTVRALREERIRRNLSMSELAGRSGLDVSMISLMERGLRNPSLDVILRIADALGIDLWLVLKEATERARAGKP